ncbi:MAG TPA: methyltransferase domain-containing protein, partial [Thermodesulfobacteriaceae bacterium]|nr:methyltransferase domain-containing protein [Thermodesulfobacteriaceae bacterium]
WLKHARDYTDYIIERFGFDRNNRIIEIASNDGYLLQYFVKRGIPVIGVEPAVNVAKVAREHGINTIIKFFGTNTARELAESGQQGDLVIGNNVLAHVPDLNDFVAGLKTILGDKGLITMEFPHLMRLMDENQFDTIYHEHFSYFSFMTVEKIFAHHGLTLFDVEELQTHGGSLRIFARHTEDEEKTVTDRVVNLRNRERKAGFEHVETYTNFDSKVSGVKRNLLDFLITAKREGKSIVGYGAAAKGNTLLNYCGIRKDFLDYVVDRSPHKQNHLLPGSHIPIYSPDRIKDTRPDYLLILPWNLKKEIMEQMNHIRKWGGRFVVPIPDTEVCE